MKPMTRPLLAPEGAPDELKGECAEANSTLFQIEFNERYWALVDHHKIEVKGTFDEVAWKLLNALMEEYVPGFRFAPAKRRQSERGERSDYLIAMMLGRAEQRGLSINEEAGHLAKLFRRESQRGPSAQTIRQRYYELKRKWRKKV